MRHEEHVLQLKQSHCLGGISLLPFTFVMWFRPKIKPQTCAPVHATFESSALL